MSPQLLHTLAAGFLKLTYVVTGLTLCYFGKDMIEKGLSTGFRADGTVASAKFRVATTSPGLVFMLAGLVIVSLAIWRQAEFEAGARAGSASLAALADQVIVSRFAEPSPEGAFARSQMEAARRALADGDRESALLSLAQAVVLDPGFLKTTLQDEALAPLAADPRFEAMVRARWALAPAAADQPSPESPQTAAVPPVVGELGMLAVDSPRSEDVAALADAMPREAGREPVTATAARLRTMVARNPRVLYKLLRQPDYRWILEDDRLVAAVRAGINVGAPVQ